MDHLDPQESYLAWLVLLAVIALLCWCLWLLNRLLRRWGVKENRVDRLGSSMLELERLVRPSAEHIVTARKDRKITRPGGEGEPPDDEATHHRRS